MSETTTETAHVVKINRIFKASRERVFAAWTEPEQIKQWFGCDQTKVKNAEVDLREGGKFLIEMETSGDGCGASSLDGSYITVRPPEELKYTWKWSGFEEPSPATTVTVKFTEQGEGTLLELTHEGFMNEEICGMHDKGWTQAIDKIEKLISE